MIEEQIKLIYGDCLEVMKAIPNESIDLIVTDPPYLINYKSKWSCNGNSSKTILGDNDYNLIENSIREMHRVLKLNSATYIFCSPKKIDYFIRYSQKAGFVIKNNIVWIKNNWTSGDLKASYGQQYEMILLLNKGRKCFAGKRLTDVWYFDRVAFQHQYHQNEKPVKLLEQCIVKHFDKGNIILDPFMGSGSTGIACIHTDRQFIGIEKDERYYETAKRRIKEQLCMLNKRVF